MLDLLKLAAVRSRGNFRWVIVALLFAATLINYMDRQILALLKPDLAKSLHWSEQDYGNIVVAFQAAYAIGQVCFGPIIRWIGTKSSYAVSIIFWSLAAMAHALVRTATGFSAARFALGLGESGNFPTAIQAVTEWFPQRQRSVATGIFNSGSNIGAILAPLVVPWLTLQFGWRTAFVALGTAGFAWLIFWFLLYGAPPPSHPSDRPAAAEKIPWARLLIYRQTWAYVATGILVGPVWWFYLFWLPDFFHKQFGLDLQSFGPPLIAVYSVTAFGSVAGGGLSAWLLRRGWSLNAARKTAALLCACCAVPVAYTPHTGSVWLAAGLFALAAAAHHAWSATLYTVVSDIFPQSGVASVVGLGGTLAAVASMIFSWFVGHVLQNTGSYSKIMVVCALAYLLALGIFHAAVPRLDPVRIPPRRG